MFKCIRRRIDNTKQFYPVSHSDKYGSVATRVINISQLRKYIYGTLAAFLSTLAHGELQSGDRNTKPIVMDLSRSAAESEKDFPWMNRKLDPDTRAKLVLDQLTMEEKIQLLHGGGFFPIPEGSNGGAGFVPGIARLGIPDLNMADSTVGVTRGATKSRYSTLMPSTIAEASTWSQKAAYDYAALVGQELRAQGYNASLAGGANLMREPRNGRAFEYRGEDPLLTGLLTAHAIRGMQDQNVIGNLKHFALNDQETGRHSANIEIDYRAARESDLLAFEIAVREAQPAMVMCAYNRVWGQQSCENKELLSDTLKDEWGFKGWVVTDWGAAHSTVNSIMAGLDQEQPGSKYFGEPLKQAVLAGKVPVGKIDSSVRRILRSMFSTGVVDNPPKMHVVDVANGLNVARTVEEQGAVLLKNLRSLLPIAKNMKTVAVIGGHADVGVLTGGGSGQVDPPGGNAVKSKGTDTLITPEEIHFPQIWWPSSPLAALRAGAPNIQFVYDSGNDLKKASALATDSDMAIVFAYSPSAEHSDVTSLELPYEQDKLIESIAAVNNKTVVVLETSGAVKMPWVDKVNSIIAAWFPGAAGGEAIANLLLGNVNFSGKLPITFPKSEIDLPHPVIHGIDVPMVPDTNSIFPDLNLKIKAPFDIHYSEGALVGYKWFEKNGKEPLFPFGHGLSYTEFEYSDLITTENGVEFTLKNVGDIKGTEVAQVYVSLPVREQLVPRQLAGWSRVTLEAGESKTVAVEYYPLAISSFDTKQRTWIIPEGKFTVYVGGSSADTDLTDIFIK
ncbi:glycosyl hydrolase [Microbulbifer sp. SH-1]|uniref:beta-glucosidase family protein n=1 Tax=Microbulbifer sp. SH-1 TaxID=2681547 RepID=UPI001408FF2D|nr:beta-glucosidase [Microbulbifer sp. SH-1]QIL91252.1 glycosyl hydrolase [Microbulbifer sp. SH-1]